MIFTLFDNGIKYGQTPLMKQAIQAAMLHARKTGRACIVEARNIDTGLSRKVQYNLDGSLVKLWQMQEARA